MARRFFYASAGLFFIVATLSIVMPEARSDVSTPQAAAISNVGEVAVATNGDLYSVLDTPNGAWQWKLNIFGGSPAPSRPIAIRQLGTGPINTRVNLSVVLENGDVYVVNAEYIEPSVHWYVAGQGTFFTGVPPSGPSPFAQITIDHQHYSASILASGDVFWGCCQNSLPQMDLYRGNIFSGQPVSAKPETWGGVKDKFRR